MALLGQPIDDRTAALALPLPHIRNYQEDDVPRLRAALELIDTALQLMGLDMDSRDDALAAADQALAARAALLEYTAARPTAVVYGYDAQGRVATVTATVGGVARVTTYTYDAQGRVATVAYPVAGGLLRQSLHSISYETLAHVPSYAQWLAGQDWTKSYRRHRKNLQLIGLNDVEKRWVLKNPSHLFALEALMATYPDALVVQCHRPPETIMASMCSLAQHTTAGWSNTFQGKVIGDDALETWSRGLRLFNTERAKHDPAQFYDLDYSALVADPVGAVADIYRHFGIEMTDEARAAISDTDEQSKQGPRAPKHTYSLADYGLTAEQVKERFAGL